MTSQKFKERTGRAFIGYQVNYTEYSFVQITYKRKYIKKNFNKAKIIFQHPTTTIL